MTDRILVGYATRYGSTQEVAEAVAKTLGEGGLAVDARLLKDVRTLEGYAAVVVGAPLFMFHWHKEALDFLSRQRSALEKLPLAIFALGPVHEPHDEAEWQASRQQLEKELAPFTWLKPVSLEIFGGKYDPEKLRFPLKMFAGKEPASDIRDWKAIDLWANSLVTRLRGEQ
jgi:menaquinone-dependent protoporphyrinogen oxidase